MVTTARSALSSVFPEKDGTTFGKQPLIVRLLRGMFTRYDAANVLLCISNLYSKMSLECLTKKLATLMCILTGQRSRTMTLLNTNYKHIDEHHCIFYLTSLLKTTGAGFRQYPLEYKRYSKQSLMLLHMLRGIY